MKRTYLIHGRIVDGTGSPAIEDGMLVLEHIEEGYDKDFIYYCGTMDEELLKEAGENDNILDLKKEYTLLPGLFNVHSHLDLELPYPPLKIDFWGPAYRSLVAYRRAAEALNCGVTTIRNVGGADDFDLALKKAVSKNLLCAPNIIACGSILTAHGGHGYDTVGSIECTGKDEFMKETRKQLAKGVDMIKLCYTGGLAGAVESLEGKQITNEELAAVIETAHAAGKKVAAHLSSDQAIRESVELGLDSVEHAYHMTESTAKLMAEKGTYLIATLCVSNGVDYLQSLNCPIHQIEKSKEAGKTHMQSIQYAVQNNVKICCGTDLLPSDPIDGTNATVHEVELLTKAGLSPLQAIKAATFNSAELCGISHITGSLKKGLMGDFIAVEGRPDENIADLRNLKMVAKNCRLIWSDVPGQKVRRFSVLQPGYEMEGGVFKKW